MFGGDENDDEDVSGSDYVDPAHLTLGDHQGRLADLPGVTGVDMHQIPATEQLPVQSKHLAGTTVLAVTVTLSKNAGYAADDYMKRNQLTAVSFNFNVDTDGNPSVTLYLVDATRLVG